MSVHDHATHVGERVVRADNPVPARQSPGQRLLHSVVSGVDVTSYQKSETGQCVSMG